MSYDPACYNLARRFLEDQDGFENREDRECLVEALAQSIQNTVELFCDTEFGRGA